jgi:hypothetical protein
VLTSHRGALAEVAANAAILVDPEDTRAITQALVALDRDADLRVHLAAQGLLQARHFEREPYAHRMRAVYAGAAGDHTTG